MKLMGGSEGIGELLHQQSWCVSTKNRKSLLQRQCASTYKAEREIH